MFFSLKWKAIVLVLAILISLSGFLVFLNSAQLKTLAKQQQQQAFVQLNKELIGILLQSYHYNLQIMDVVPLLHTNGDSTHHNLTSILEENWPILQLNWDIDRAALYNQQGNLLWQSEKQNLYPKNIEPKLGPYWTIDCSQACRQIITSPILDDHGQTFYLSLDVSMADMLIDFSRISDTDIGIITDPSSENQPIDHIKNWQKDIKLITNPNQSLRVINTLQSQVPFYQGIDKNTEIIHQTNTYNISITPLDHTTNDGYFIIIKNSSASAKIMQTARNFQVLVAIGGITISCTLLLLFLWRPIQRLHRQAELLPKLTTGDFTEALKQLKKNRSNHWLKDEIDTLNSTEEEVCLQLTEMRQEISKKTDNLHNMAMYDSLTDLANRRAFMQYLNEILNRSQPDPPVFSLLFIDLDNFKRINDSMGHNAGDELLKVVAKRLHACVRSTDTIARLGGDEFCIILNSADTENGATIVSGHILTSLRDPIKLGATELIVSASIGIVTAPEDGATSEELLRNADLAMYKAKALGRNKYQVFNHSMTDQAVQEMTLEHDLRRAIQNQEFVLHYQPQINMHSNQIFGFEALLRWEHPDKGLLFPDAFISTLEETGLINELGSWIIEQACHTLRSWLNLGAKPVRIAINISPRQLQNNQLGDQISETLKRHNIPPPLLELEITESILMEDMELTQYQLYSIQKLGVSIAIDDFGTGHSSLSYLKELPLDILKIDRSFIKDLVEEYDDQEIVSAIIAMAHKLKLKVIAEGVETKEHQEFLLNNECDYGQGYLYSRPVPAETALGLIIPEQNSPVIQPIAAN